MNLYIANPTSTMTLFYFECLPFLDPLPNSKNQNKHAAP